LSGKYEEIGSLIGALADKKNAAYGNSIHDAGKIMRILYPRGINPDQMDDALAMIRILDKMFRIATAKRAFGENPFQDIAGYGIVKCRDLTNNPSTYHSGSDCHSREGGNPGEKT